MRRLLISLSGLLLASPGQAYQCHPITLYVERSPIVFVGLPQKVLEPNVPATPDGSESVSISGAPEAYDWVRFAVVEPLKGDVPATVDLLCPKGKCRIGDPNGPLLIALPALSSPESRQAFNCGSTYLAPPPGWPREAALETLVESLRAERNANDRQTEK